MHCSNCGNKISRDVNFCSECGAETENYTQVKERHSKISPDVKIERFQWILGWIVIVGIVVQRYFMDVPGIQTHIGLIGCWLYYVLHKVYLKLTRIEQALGISEFKEKGK